MTRRDPKGRKLRTGEYYEAENNRYIYRKMIKGKRYSITCDTLEELRKKEPELLVSIQQEKKDIDRLSQLTLDQYFEVWCQNAGKQGRKATTYTNYKAYYQAHIKGQELGCKKISEIRKMHCQEVFNKMISNGAKKSTLNNMKGCLNLILNDAEDDGIIDRNPCKNIRFNNTESNKRTPISAEQIGIFMRFVKKDAEFSYYYPFFVVLFNLGARIGEVTGLSWDSIGDTTVTINKSLNRYRLKEYGFTVALGSTKSKHSERTIEVNDLVIDAFECQRKNQLISGVSSTPIRRVDDYGRVIDMVDNLVFTNMKGSPLTEPVVIELIHRIVKKQNKEAEETGELKLEYFTPHQARHTYSTMAYEAGADGKEVAERLGHASEAVSREVYTHLRGKKKKEQEEVINRIRIS